MEKESFPGALSKIWLKCTNQIPGERYGNDKVSEWSTYKPNDDNRCKKSQIVIVLSVERNYPQIYGSG